MKFRNEKFSAPLSGAGSASGGNKESFVDKKIQIEQEKTFDNINTIWIEDFENPRIIKAQNGPITLGTAIGIGREQNEDSAVLNTSKDAFAIIDGLGGMGYGAEAARILAEELQKGFERDEDIQKIQINASRRMLETGIGKGGACYAAVIIKNRTMSIYRAGDIELLVANKVNKKNRFHTEPEGSENVVFNAVQGTKPGKTTRDNFELRANDRVYLASDGLWSNISPEEAIKETIDEPIDSAIKKLYQLAIDRMKNNYEASKDNITILIYDIVPKS